MCCVADVPVHQCWCWADWCVHHPEHHPGEDEVRRSGRPLPDRQDAPNTEAGHGADRGIHRIYYLVKRLYSIVNSGDPFLGCVFISC